VIDWTEAKSSNTAAPRGWLKDLHSSAEARKTAVSFESIFIYIHLWFIQA
jgi:hypothetical protein